MVYMWLGAMLSFIYRETLRVTIKKHHGAGKHLWFLLLQLGSAHGLPNFFSSSPIVIPWGLPTVGHVPFLRHDLHQQFAELAKTYGPIMRLLLGAKTLVVITSPKIDLQGVVRESEKRREWLDPILDDEVKQKLNKDSEAVVKKQSLTKQSEDFLQVLMSLCEEGGEAKELSIPTSKPCLWWVYTFFYVLCCI